LEILLPGFSVWLRAWEARVGRVKLYVLDSNDADGSFLYAGGASATRPVAHLQFV
jgi:starch phosphorylase